MLFGKPKKLVIIPKSDTVDVYTDKDVNNFLSFPLNLYKETADIDEANNTYGDIKPPSKFKVFKQKQNVTPAQGINPMQKAQEKKGF
jgi:hypothetical protein